MTPASGLSSTLSRVIILSARSKRIAENRLIKLNRKLFRIIGEIKKNPAPRQRFPEVRVNREDVITAYNYLENRFPQQTGRG